MCTNTANASVWRPVRSPIVDYPLAICDGSTVVPDELVLVDHVKRTYIGESVYPLYNPSLRWYYLNEQTKDEVLLLKMSDTNSKAGAKCVQPTEIGENVLTLIGCPHTAFRHTLVPEDAMPRESIEVRALVFSEW